MLETPASDLELYEVPFMQISAMKGPFSMEEMETALAICRLSSSPGPDYITYAALRHLDNEAREILLHHLNVSWSDGVVPSDWKRSRLLRILKQGKTPLELKSYRHIALSSCVSKLTERMILTPLEWFHEYNNVNPDAMRDIRRGRSLFDNVIDLVSSI